MAFVLLPRCAGPARQLVPAGPARLLVPAFGPNIANAGTHILDQATGVVATLQVSDAPAKISERLAALRHRIAGLPAFPRATELRCRALLYDAPQR